MEDNYFSNITKLLRHLDLFKSIVCVGDYLSGVLPCWYSDFVFSTLNFYFYSKIKNIFIIEQYNEYFEYSWCLKMNSMSKI